MTNKIEDYPELIKEKANAMTDYFIKTHDQEGIDTWNEFLKVLKEWTDFL